MNSNETVFSKEMSPNISKLYENLITKALGNRSEEWFTQSMFNDVVETKNKNDRFPIWNTFEECSVIVRRAVAINHMLIAMTDADNSKKTHTAEILEGDLLLGVIPMGSNGLGKMFPRFLTDDEIRAGSVTNRNASSLFGHNSMNYEELLANGLNDKIASCVTELDILRPLIEDCSKVSNSLSEQYDKDLNDNNITEEEKSINLKLLVDKEVELVKYKKKFDFYWSVRQSCQAVIDYANRFAILAENKAKEYPNKASEYLELARIAKKVPAKGADTFHEAMQSICFFHIALHASMNLISLGRLDQVLNPYLEKVKEEDKNRALEIFECFIIKCAGRLNLNLNHLIEQDHVDYGTVLGTHSYYIDQKAGVNNFLQNIIVGGKKANGEDATNECTYLILQAFENVNLPAPGIYVRIHKKSPKKLIQQIAASVFKTKNNPAILNDEVMIPALYSALMQDENATNEVRNKMQELANDYCVDGCWEPILNGKSDWTFGMLVGMKAVESALNQGASMQKNEALLRGAKQSLSTPVPQSFEDIIKYFETHLQFFVDQTIMSLFIYYMIDENAAPSPLFSAYLEGCMEKGKDKASGGANHNLGGIVLGSVPDMVNQLCAIKKWVYEEKKYTLEQVCQAISNNFGEMATTLTEDNLAMYKEIRCRFDNDAPKFGNNDPIADELTRDILDIYVNCVEKSSHFGKKLFQDKAPRKDWRRIAALRGLAGYYGLPLGMTYDIKMKITAGMGTFEQYHWQGNDIAASANRLSGTPIAPNFSAVPGTACSGVLGTLNSLAKFKLNRFAAGVITDVCLDSENASENIIEQLVGTFIENKGGMMTIAIGTRELYTEIYKAVVEAQTKTDEEAVAMLAQYANVNVRIGGWQSPFITIPLEHMENYINRPVKYQNDKINK